jgi:excinuclease ABC subunit C
MSETLNDKRRLLPTTPGCYLFKNQQGHIIYVGKSKSLRHRVNSYFTGAHDLKTQLLVSEIVDLEHIVTASELEALVLELNLIKQHTPKYNIKLADDASYPYIQITKEAHPRLLITRRPSKKHAVVYGPFPSAYSAKNTVKLLDKLYPLRKCNVMPNKECLYYHLGQCLAPCVHPVSTEDYEPILREIHRFLNGDSKKEQRLIRDKMQEASDQLDYEAAAEYRDLLRHMDATIEKQQIILSDFVNRDVFGYAVDDNILSVSVLYYRQGKLIHRDVDLVEITDPVEEALQNYIAQFYINYPNVMPKEILLPLAFPILEDLLQATVLVPQKGNKKRIVELAVQNAADALDQQRLLFERQRARTIGATEELATMLAIPRADVIEVFDNSNIQGTNAVSGMVVFRHGKPSKSDYRKFNIKTVVGANDVASMKEVVYRRYFRLLQEDRPLPDVIMVDGGVAQANAATDVISSLGLSIPVVGLKKGVKHTLSALIVQGSDVPLKPNSHVYALCNAMAEEVHRYALEFHRQARQKSAFASVLETIEGLGPKRIRKLHQHFSSIQEIGPQDIEKMLSIGIPSDLAKTIVDTLRMENTE